MWEVRRLDVILGDPVLAGEVLGGVRLPAELNLSVSKLEVTGVYVGRP